MHCSRAEQAGAGFWQVQAGARLWQSFDIDRAKKGSLEEGGFSDLMEKSVILGFWAAPGGSETL